MREFSVEDKGAWKWTAMIMGPEEYVSAGAPRGNKEVVEKKKRLARNPEIAF